MQDMLMRFFGKLGDFEIVGVMRDLDGLDPLLMLTNIDWLVISSMPDKGISEEIKALHVRYPAIRILVMAADGSEVLVNWLEPRELHMEGATLSELIALMRSPGHYVPG
jgi:DNA-binding NarL/FixJ family response regulator